MHIESAVAVIVCVCVEYSVDVGATVPHGPYSLDQPPP